jgi:ATP-binding cassette subfamily B protein
MARQDAFELTQPKGVILRRLFRIGRAYRGLLAAGIALALCISGFALLQPYLVGRGINATLQSLREGGATWERFYPLARIVAALLACALVQIGLQYGNTILMTHLRLQVLTDLRKRLYRRILGQSFSFFDRRDTGQLINRAIGDVNMIRQFYMTVLIRGAEVLFSRGGYMTAIALLDPYVAMVAVPFVPVYVVLSLLFVRKVHPQFHDMRHELDRSTSILSENVQGIQVVRAFGREPEETARYDTAVEGILGRWLALVRSFAFFRPLIAFLGDLSLLLMLAMASYRVLHGLLGVGAMYTVFRWSRIVTNHMRTIARMSSAVDHSLVSAERVFEILDEKSDIRSPADAKPLPPGRGRVVFENVTFGYDSDTPVLCDVSLDIPAGTNVALVGATGCGKSSLIKLLPRFYAPQAGRILLDGVDICRVDLRALRAEIGFVFQDTFLFSASLADNIAYGVPEAEHKVVTGAARRAQVDAFAEAFDEGYETRVGERGITLSGGQRQRVAIARALLVDPRILILDDATASVDSGTERAIQDALADVMEHRTTFIIAPRASTVRRADWIVVLDAGRVVQQGRHDELAGRAGPYRDFCALQLQLGLDEEGGAS